MNKLKIVWVVLCSIGREIKGFIWLDGIDKWG